MPNYLVTSNARLEGGVYHFDSTAAQIRRIHRGSYRGLTRGPDGAFYTVSGHRNPRRDSSTICRLDPESWAVETLVTHPVKDSHDLKWIGDHFYLVASVGNQILRLDERARLVDRVRLVDDDRDLFHANCLVEIGGELYCTVFTLSPGDRREKSTSGAWFTEGKLLRLDFARGRYEVVYEPLFQPHSLVRHGEALYLVESHISTVTRFDLGLGERRPLAQYSGFLRGLAFGPGEAVLGICRYYSRLRRRFRPLPWYRQWSERVFPFDGIYVVDHRWRVRRKVPLPGSEIYDLVLLEPTETRPPLVTATAGRAGR